MRWLVRAGAFVALLIVLLLALAWLRAPNHPVVIGGAALSSYPVTVVSFPTSSVVGGPSLSAAFVERVLATYGSPAVGLGRALYAASQQFEIDDAYALAFFWQASRLGTTGVARSTRNLGTLICAGYPTCWQGYRFYPTWQAGAWDWFRLVQEKYLARGLSTVQTIVPLYAPPSERNDVGAYIAAVVQAVSTWRAGRVRV